LPCAGTVVSTVFGAGACLAAPRSRLQQKGWRLTNGIEFAGSEGHARSLILSTRGGLFIGPLHPFAKGDGHASHKECICSAAPLRCMVKRRAGFSPRPCPPRISFRRRRRCRPGLVFRHGRPRAGFSPAFRQGRKDRRGPCLGLRAGQRGGPVIPVSRSAAAILGEG
jgi:hypothetical protein